MVRAADNWRDLLSDPPQPRNFAEMMKMIILMAAEDSRTQDGPSARDEFQERVGYDIYEETLEFLEAPLFAAPTSPTNGDALAGVEERTALWVVPADLKLLRELLCAIQAGVWHDNDTSRAQMQGLIDEIDRHRPLGPDGKHGDRHTASCGCEDRA